VRIVFAALVFATTLMAQDQKSHPLQKDARGLLHVDDTYYGLAASTGGDFYFWAPGEFAASALNVPLHFEDVVLDYGVLTRERTFEIPVDAGVKELTLFSGIQRKDLAVLIRPDGTPVQERDEGVALQSFQHMLIATVRSPKTGIWKLELTGEGKYAVTAHVKPAGDGPELVTFRFVEPGGRPGHEGLFPLTRDVRSDEKLSCSVTLSGTKGDVLLSFVTSDGTLLTSIPLSRVGDDEFLGECRVPEVPFRAVVTGRDGQGAAFMRSARGLIAPK
jgi:hypothetical protein